MAEQDTKQGGALLRNEFFELVIDPNLGAVRAIYDFHSRGPRLAQQLAMRLRTGDEDDAYTIMAADVPSHMEYQAPAGFAVSLSGDDGDALRGYFEQLAAGGVTAMPLQKQVWGDEFGMCDDKFGISWLVNISQPQA